METLAIGQNTALCDPAHRLLFETGAQTQNLDIQVRAPLPDPASVTQEPMLQSSSVQCWRLSVCSAGTGRST